MLTLLKDKDINGCFVIKDRVIKTHTSHYNQDYQC